MPVSEKLYGVDLFANEAAYILLNVKKGINILKHTLPNESPNYTTPHSRGGDRSLQVMS